MCPPPKTGPASNPGPVSNPQAQRQPDAIVVGSGATGGVAAMVLAEAGLQVLMLAAGPQLTARSALGREPLNSLRRLRNLSSGKQVLQRHHPGFWKHNPDLFVDERANPYSTPEDAPFLWSRGRQVGGKSLTWGGITLRLSDYEFKAGERDGRGPSWPIDSSDLAPYTAGSSSCWRCMAPAMACPNSPMASLKAPCPSPQASSTCSRPLARNWGCR